MISRDYRIADNTNIIVFDLEWNQPMGGVEYDFDVSKLKGEIIEIGAERYHYESGKLIREESFSKIIRPRYFTRLNYHVKKLTKKTEKDLKRGVPFEEAYEAFKTFCGDNYILAGWGNSDPDMLKVNLEFFGMDSKLGVPFVDLQPMFSRFVGEGASQRSVEYAVDFFSISKSINFHDAWADSYYTGRILKTLCLQYGLSNVIADIQTALINPDLPKDYSFVGTPAETMEGALEALSNALTNCPICDTALSVIKAPFRIRKSEYALYTCEDHGEFFCRSRIKRNKLGLYYASKILRQATSADIALIDTKYDEFLNPVVEVEEEALESNVEEKE